MTLQEKRSKFNQAWIDGRWVASDFSDQDWQFISAVEYDFGTAVHQPERMNAELMKNVNMVYEWITDAIKLNTAG